MFYILTYVNISQKSVIEVQSSTLVGKTYNLCAAGCQSYPPLKLLTTDNQHNCCPPENPRLHLFKPGIEPQRISLNGVVPLYAGIVPPTQETTH